FIYCQLTNCSACRVGERLDVFLVRHFAFANILHLDYKHLSDPTPLFPRVIQSPWPAHSSARKAVRQDATGQRILRAAIPYYISSVPPPRWIYAQCRVISMLARRPTVLGSATLRPSWLLFAEGEVLSMVKTSDTILQWNKLRALPSQDGQ